MVKKSKVLIIEDNTIWQQRYLKWLGPDYLYAFATTTEEAEQLFTEFQPDIILQDLGLPQIEQGLIVLDFLISKGSDAKIIVITASQDHQNALEAQKRGAYSYFYKNENIQDELPLLVKRATRMQSLERENSRLKNQLTANLQFDQIIAVSKQLQNILRLIEHTKATKEPVLLTGESGVGKEVIARHIHSRSMPPNSPFIAINAAALPENLLENELYGHEKGAFTGANDFKQGQFELAENGTLFLDEIGDLPIAMQAKLLRVLQEKCFYRLGGTKEIQANFRLIAATNRILQDEITKKNFREDLFYRLNVIPIHIPPLRERPDDIPALVTFFIKKYCNSYGHRILPKVDPALVAYFSKLDWKGNIRELESTLTRMLVINPSRLSLEDVPKDIQEKENLLLKDALQGKWTLEEFTRMYAHLVYIHLGKNKKETCKFLNINYRTLNARLIKE